MRDADKKAQLAALYWLILGTGGESIALFSDGPTWLRFVIGLLSLLFGFFAGLVAIPDESTSGGTQ